MKKTRFTAILLCVTTLFALFAGGAYAEEGVTYIEESTLVIEDGKVVSGDKSLVDKGIVVIGGASDSSEEPDEETSAEEVSKAPSASTEESKEENNEDTFGSPVVDKAPAQSNKTPVKDNSALIKPDASKEDETESKPESETETESKEPEKEYDIILPEEIPTAVNPNVPGAEVKAPTGFIELLDSPSLGWHNTDTANISWCYYTNYVIMQTMKVSREDRTVSHLTYVTHQEYGSCTFYRLNDTNPNLKPSGSGNVFQGTMVEVEPGKTFKLYAYSDAMMYIDGRTVNNGTGTNWPTSFNNTNRTLEKVSSSLLWVHGNSSTEKATLIMNSVTVQNALSSGNGAGIYVGAYGVLRMTNCVIDNCDTDANGGGIYVEKNGSVTLANTTIKNCNAKKGGAIYVAGTATLKFSSVNITNNEATDGAGIYHENGTNSITTTDFAEVTDTRSGKHAYGYERNSYKIEKIDAGRLNIGSSTNFTNTANHGAGIYVAGGTLTYGANCITNDNVAVNGGGVFINGGKFVMSSGIIGYNYANHGAGIYLINSGQLEITGGSIYHNKTNLDGEGTGGAIKTDGTGSQNVTIKITGGDIHHNSSNAAGGAMWIGNVKSFEMTGGTVRDNTAGTHGGGMFFNRPTTETVVIKGQTGTVSIYNNHADSGQGGGLCFGHGDLGTMRAEIGGGSNNVQIYDNTAKWGGGVYLKGKNGLGTVDVTVKSNTNIYINDSLAATSDTNPGGGGVFIEKDCHFTLQGGAVYENTGVYGPGVYVKGGEFTLSGGEVRTHTTTNNGGGIYLNEGTVNIQSGSVNNNHAKHGGGIFMLYGTLNMSGGSITNNHADQSTDSSGGAIRSETHDSGSITYACEINISGGSITGNTSIANGGAMWLGTLIGFTMSGGTVSNNTSGGDGGGMFFNRPTQNPININGADGIVNINNNTASRYGGGLVFGNFKGAISAEIGGGANKVNIYSNTAGTTGGGIHLLDEGTGNINVTIKDKTDIHSNIATGKYGGGIYVGEESTLTMEGGEIRNHKTDFEHGAGMYINGGEVTVSGTAAIHDNTVSSYGGGILIIDGKLNVEGGNFYNNNAWQGGAILAETALPTPHTGGRVDIEISGGKIYDNVAGYAGGALNLDSETYVTISGGDIYSNDTTGGNGGGLWIGALKQFNMTGGNIYENTTSGHGGGIYFRDCNPVLSGGTIYGNEGTSATDSSGGGIYMTKGNATLPKLTLSGVTVGGTSLETGNKAYYGGGVCITEGCALDMSGGAINYNNATRNGGGLYAQGDILINITGGDVIGNEATIVGGGMYIGGKNESVSIHATDSDINISDNHAHGTGADGGGGIAFSNWNRSNASGETIENPLIATVQGSGNYKVNINGNSAIYGGGIRFLNSGYGLIKVTVGSGVNVFNNTSTAVEGATYKGGGGIFVGGNSELVLDGANIYENYADFYGAGVIISGGTATLKSGEIHGHEVAFQGGGVYLDRKGTLIMEGGAIYNNTANLAGGGVFVAYDNLGAATLELKDGELRGNEARYGGGAFVIGNATMSGGLVTGNKATGHGGGIEVGANEGEDSDSVFNMTGGTISGNYTTGEHDSGCGAGIWVGVCKTFKIEGGADTPVISGNYIQNKGQGAGIYLNRSVTDPIVIKNCTVTGNECRSADDGKGGGICLSNNYLDTSNTISLVDITVTNNSAKEGGGIFINGGNANDNGAKLIFAEVSGITVTGNTANNGSGAGMYLGGVTVEISNLTATGNTITAGGHGAGVYVDGKSNVTVTGGTVTDNTNTGSGCAGGGIDTEGTLTLEGVTVSGNTAEIGGGVSSRVTGKATLTGCTLTGNTASNGTGGGLYVSYGATATARNTYIYGNFAKANPKYSGDTTNVSGKANGTGGGVAVVNDSTFTLTSGGIYGNEADTAGDDVFANGYGSKLSLPSAEAIDKTYFNGEDGVQYYWMEDYKDGDTKYTAGLNGNANIGGNRYRTTPVSVRAYVDNIEAQGHGHTGTYINDSDNFVAITFGVPRYNVGSIKITAPESDVPGQRFVFTLVGENAIDGEITLSVSLGSGESVTITNLFAGEYTILQQDPWSWRYEFTTVKVDDNAAITENSAKVTIVGDKLEETHTVTYTNEKENNKWLSHNSECEKNVAVPETQNTVFYMAEAKRRQTL